MSDQFLGEIRMFGCNYAPFQWALCNGQIMSISQNTALFSLLGTNYGGNGTSNFGLPNLQGMAPMCYGQGSGLTPRVVGETGGASNVTVLLTEMPAHTHTMMAEVAPANLKTPTNATALGRSSTGTIYQPTDGSLNSMSPQMIGFFGGNQPHSNMMPYLTVNFCIALAGIFPPRG
jgi:microcystin-dependent protein